MKIIFILPVYWPAIGGCELHTRELVKRLASSHQVIVITQVDSQEQKLKARKGRPANNWFVTTLWAPRSKRVFIDNNSTVHRLGLNLIERAIAYAAARFHPYAENFTMKILTILFKRKITSLTEGADLIHCIHGGVSYLGQTALQIAREKGIPFVYTPVAHLFTRKDMTADRLQPQSNSYFPDIHFERWHWRDRFWFEICSQSDALITMTDYEKSFFQSKGIDEKKIFSVGVGPILETKGDGQAFRHKHQLYNQKIVLFLGRKHETKGLKEVLEATRLVWQKHPDVYFFFIGHLEGNSKDLFQLHQDKRIIEIGFVNDDEKANALDACDIFCLPSIEESLGGVYLEAWMHEKPVIAADIPPLRELTSNGQGGFLVIPDAEAIAGKIILLLEDAQLRTKMGAWGKNRVLSFYSWNRIEKQMNEIYNMLTSSRV